MPHNEDDLAIWDSDRGGVTETRRDETRPNSATLKQIMTWTYFRRPGQALSNFPV